MPRTLESVMRVMGPFLGVNEPVAGDIQPPQYAEEMVNAVLNRGMIEARPGLRNVLHIEDAATAPWINAIAPLPHSFQERDAEGTLTGKSISNGRVLIIASEDASSPKSTLFLTLPFVPAVVAHPFHDPAFEEVGQLPELSREARGDIVHFGDKSFIAFADWQRPCAVKWVQDNGPALLAGGLVVHRAGFDHPPASISVDHDDEVSGELIDQEFPAGRFAFAVTIYDSRYGVESNADYVSGFPDNPWFYELDGTTLLKFNVDFDPLPDPDTTRMTHIRVYAIIDRLDEDPDGIVAGGETAYRLIAEIAHEASEGEVSFPMYVKRSDVRIPPIASGDYLSVRGIGPFVPTRNGPPPKSNAIVVYDNKVCYASTDPDTYGVLFYSADGNGEHVAGDAFISFDDEGREPITGLAVYQGRLLVFKETAIYVIAGTLTQHTNDTVALGQAAPQPLFSKYRVQADTGCFNRSGSLALKECDGILYYNALDGIYGFDGLRARKVSDPISKTHALIPEASRDKCSMANDRRTGLLWIHYAGVDDKAFCFDYRKGVGDPSVGTWTIHDLAAGAIRPIAISLVADVPSAVCPVLSPDPLILAGTGGEPARLLEMLASHRGKDQALDTIDTDGRPVPGVDLHFHWRYLTPWMSLGLLDRAKRIHTVTLFYGPGAGDTYYLEVRVEQERTHSGWFDGDLGRNVVFGTVAIRSPTGRPTQKFAVNRRGTRIKLRISGGRGYNCVGPFTGFAIDAEPIGRR